VPTFEKTPRNNVRRMPERGDYDTETIYAIVDEAKICHVGFAIDNQPFVIPTIHARYEDKLYLHGAKASRLLKHIAAGNPICVTITLLDGLVLARSVFHHSMNYRSVVLFGTGKIVEDDEAKMCALEVLTNHVVDGRWDDARKPTPKELNATTVVEMSLESASAKVRVGPPGDEDEDYALPVWAGVLPLRQQAMDVIQDPKLSEGIPVPEYISKLVMP
jgi:nitroimidazol reductase NimA-like FMN-containing flavoprotein (pyridoxamine 5'-phosphate oxidase superfamily)